MRRCALRTGTGRRCRYLGRYDDSRRCDAYPERAIARSIKIRMVRRHSRIGRNSLRGSGFFRGGIPVFRALSESPESSGFFPFISAFFLPPPETDPPRPSIGRGGDLSQRLALPVVYLRIRRLMTSQPPKSCSSMPGTPIRKSCSAVCRSPTHAHSKSVPAAW